MNKLGQAISDAVNEVAKEKAIAKSAANIREYLFAGGPDTQAEDIAEGERFGGGETIRAAWAEAKQTEREMLEAGAAFSVPKVQPSVEKPRVEIVKPKLQWKQMKDGSWSYSVNGGMLRRHFGPPPKLDELAQPKPEEPKPEEEEKKAAVSFVRKYGWAEVVIPEGVDEIEALTYVPGLVGQIVDWIVAGARRPNRVMALGVALAVVGTLIGRRVEGPTGCATHLYIFILAPTGWGKDHPLWCGEKLMIAVGAKSLLGPGEFLSGRGIIRYLKRNPLVLCIVDELGDVFQLINGQLDNPWVTDILGHLKKCYNSWKVVHTGETMKDESVTINHPALSIVGACTAQSFFEALKPADVEGAR